MVRTGGVTSFNSPDSFIDKILGWKVNKTHLAKPVFNGLFKLIYPFSSFFGSGLEKYHVHKQSPTTERKK